MARTPRWTPATKQQLVQDFGFTVFFPDPFNQASTLTMVALRETTPGQIIQQSDVERLPHQPATQPMFSPLLLSQALQHAQQGEAQLS